MSDEGRKSNPVLRLTAGLSALPYVGGKAYNAPSGVGRWVASLLPQDVALYVEPFAGHLGVLLQRYPAPAEIANDISKVIINWWRVIQDPALTDELASRLDRLPLASEWHYNQALRFLEGWEHSDDVPCLEAAFRWTIQICMGVFGGGGISFALRKSSRGSSSPSSPTFVRNVFPSKAKLEALSVRMRNVQFSTRDAVDVIRFISDEEDALIYADPPYPSSPNYYDRMRKTGTLNPQALAEALKSCRGYVALSGQVGDPWDDLLPAFKRTTRPSVLRGMGWVDKSGPVQKMTTEAVWTNYPPDDFVGQPGLF